MTVPGYLARPSGRAPAADGLPVAVDPSTASFRALALQVRAMGLLDRRPGYYRVKITLTIVAFLAGWVLFVIVGNSWTTLAVAAWAGIIFTQLGFIGHDAGHNQVFGTRRRNRLLGLTVGNVLIGLSFGWWVHKHNAHHAHPNETGPRPRYRRRSPLGLAWRAGKQAPPCGVVAGTLAGAALLPPHAAAKRRYARTRDQEPYAATRPRLGGRSLSHHGARRAVPDGGAVGALPAQRSLSRSLKSSFEERSRNKEGDER